VHDTAKSKPTEDHVGSDTTEKSEFEAGGSSPPIPPQLAEELAAIIAEALVEDVRRLPVRHDESAEATPPLHPAVFESKNFFKSSGFSPRSSAPNVPAPTRLTMRRRASSISSLSRSSFTPATTRAWTPVS
jgi:hypothetical protein